MYVEELIGPRHREHDARGDDRGLPGPRRGALTIEEGRRRGAEGSSTTVEAAGVAIDDVTRVLEEEGVQKFSDSFAELLDGIKAKRGELVYA